jgi:hypothetical protein
MGIVFVMAMVILDPFSINALKRVQTFSEQRLFFLFQLLLLLLQMLFRVGHGWL